MRPHCDIPQKAENKVSGRPANTGAVAVIKGRAASEPYTGRRSALVNSGLTLMHKVDEDMTT